MAASKPLLNDRWVAVFKCKFCGAAVRLEGLWNGEATCNLYKKQQLHECNAATVGILEQIGAELAPGEIDD